MPILSKFQNLESLSLNGNRLQTLPTDMGGLEKLNELDISNNLFRDVADVIPTLQSLPRLTHLIYSFKNQAEEQQLVKQLPFLERLNKKPLNIHHIQTTSKKNMKSSSRQMKLDEKELVSIAQIYDDIRQIYTKSRYYVQKELADQFDKSVDNIIADLSNKMAAATSEEQAASSAVTCRYSLIDLCFVKIITYFYHFDKNIASVLERIHDHIAESFKNMNEILQTSADKSRSQIAHVVVKKEELYKSEIKRLKGLQETYMEQISILQKKNAELMEKLTKNSKINVLENTIGNIIKRKSPLKSATKTKDQKQNEITIADLSASKIANKNLSLNQMHDLISQILSSKLKHNELVQASGSSLSAQSLEAHMYTYLNQKYGLKHITVEWAMSIVNGVRKYAGVDVEVGCFGKMLRNQIQQKFIIALGKVKQNIRANIKKWKGNEHSPLTLHESEQILLMSGFKREVIDSLTAKIRQDQIVNGLVSSTTIEQLAMGYTLNQHGSRLRRLVPLFRECDSDDDGIIDQDGLVLLIQKTGVKDADLQQIGLAIEGGMTGRMTFSNVVDGLIRREEFKEFFSQ